MKGIALSTILLMGGLFLLFYLAGSHLIGVANLVASLTAETYQGCVVKEGEMVIPLLGYYSCEKGPEEVLEFDIPYGAFYNEYKVCCNYFTDSCKWVLQRKNGEVIKSGTIRVGECVVTKWDSAFTGDRVIKLYFSSYSLYNYPGTGGKYLVKKGSCDLPLIHKPLCVEGDCPNGKWDGNLEPGESTNYLDKWVLAPKEYNLVEYQGEKVYCTGNGYLYKLKKWKFDSTCYWTPGDYWKKVDCCPGQISGNYECGKDFKWHPIEKEEKECFTDFDCPGQGLWRPDYSKKGLAIRYKCVNFKCVREERISECSKDTDCPSGYYCDFSEATGVGVCKKYEEEVPERWRDREPSKEEKEFDLLRFIVGFLIVYLIVFLMLFAINFLPLPLPKLNLQLIAIVAFIITLGITLLLNLNLLHLGAMVIG